MYIATNVIENFCLWNNRLEPLYVIVAAVIAINIWVLQMTIWGPCIFAGGKDGVDGPGYCPCTDSVGNDIIPRQMLIMPNTFRYVPESESESG